MTGLDPAILALASGKCNAVALDGTTAKASQSKAGTAEQFLLLPVEDAE